MSTGTEFQKSIRPIAVQAYGVGVMHGYPCGCTFEVNANAEYVHYCKPTCEFDRSKVGKVSVPGYHYVGWDKAKCEAEE